ncbi:MAG: hypothetical protein KDJ42_03580 [Alphaproteobacteria bacterium]|nr:hypothetical protein [Alphaproteobacteria bacterium]
MGLDKLTEQDLGKTYQGLQGLLEGMDAKDVKVPNLPAGPLKALIENQAKQLQTPGAKVGQQDLASRFGNFMRRFTGEEDADPRTGTREAARSVLDKGIKGAGPDMLEFHALLAVYGGNPVFDDTISAAEKADAQRIADGLAKGQSINSLRGDFASSARDAAAKAAEAKLAAVTQSELEVNVDAALAARGLIRPDQIGTLTEMQRAQGLNELMATDSEYMQQEGVFEEGRMRLDHVQDMAFGEKGWQVQSGALDVARAGVNGMHMAEEVQTWMESGDANQIKMAQAVLGIPSTGRIDRATLDAGNDYIRAGYQTDFEDLNFVENATGSTNPTMVFNAANGGRLYVPDVGTEQGVAELKAAGLSDDQITAMKSLPSAQDEGVDPEAPGVTTREEFMAREYMGDHAVYTKVIEARNEHAAARTLDAQASTLKTEFENSAESLYPRLNVDVLAEMKENPPELRDMVAGKSRMLDHRERLVNFLEHRGEDGQKHAEAIRNLDGEELVGYLKQNRIALLNVHAETDHYMDAIRRGHTEYKNAVVMTTGEPDKIAAIERSIKAAGEPEPAIGDPKEMIAKSQSPVKAAVDNSAIKAAPSEYKPKSFEEQLANMKKYIASSIENEIDRRAAAAASGKDATVTQSGANFQAPVAADEGIKVTEERGFFSKFFNPVEAAEAKAPEADRPAPQINRGPTMDLGIGGA